MSLEKEFVLYPEALELKELGFDKPCFGWFASDKSLVKEITTKTDFILAPTFSQAFRWFREHQEWPIESWIRPFISQQPKSYSAMIWTRGQIIHAGVFSTYDEAQLGLLRKLIEIVKTKQ